MKNWDPKPHERAYYRHVTTGDLGWVVRRDGKDWIRLDRGESEQLRQFRRADWAEDREIRKLSEAQVARVAFEADRALSLVMGFQVDPHRDWLSLTDEQRIAWVRCGPVSNVPRQKLNDAVRRALMET